MAYYLYKKIRDKRRENSEKELQEDNVAPTRSQELSRPQKLNDEINGSTIRKPDEEKDLDPINHDETSHDKHLTFGTDEEKRTTWKYRLRIIGGVFFPLLVWSLNNTMIAAALPFIASDFHQFAQLNWIIAAPNLVATAFVPSFGQFADIFGRYPTLQISTLLFVLGSVLCAAAPTSNFPMLLAGRGIQGLAGSGIMILTRIALSDRVSLRDNAINNTFFSLVIGIGYGIGPVAGGYLTSVTWRWCFIINIPLCVVGVVLTHFLARPLMLGPQDLQGQDGTVELSRSESFVERMKTVDFGGQFLFLFGMGLFVLALTWAGAYYPWNDVHVIAPLVIGSIILILFFVWEYLFLPGRILGQKFPHQHPMIPLNLVWTRNAGLLMYINFITGMALYSAFYFVDLYFTIVKDFGPNKAGTNLLYYLPGLAGGVYAAMFLCQVSPRKTWYPLSSGTVIEALGITLLAIACHSSNLPFIYGMLVLTGLGSGIRFMPNTLHAVGYFREHVATVISLMSLSVSFGSTLASTIMLNIFNNHMDEAGISLVHGSASVSSFGSLDQLPRGEQVYVREHAQCGIVLAFYGISSFMWLGVVAAAFLGNVNIKPKRGSSGDFTDEERLTKGAYLASLFRRKSEDSGEKA